MTRIAYLNGTGRVLDLDGLDPGIASYVEVLWTAGIESYESCQGGSGHSSAAPAVRFHGTRSEGFRALHVAVHRELPVAAIRRFWSVDRTGDPHGPYWEMTFRYAASPTPRSACSEADCPSRRPDARA